MSTISEPVPTRADLPRWLGALLVAALVLASTGLRIQQTFTDPGYTATDDTGRFKSDPGLLFYITKRLADPGGTPTDFRADPRIEHPDLVDIPARFTVGQEYLIAWLHGLGDFELSELCVIVMSFLASLAVLGVYGATWQITRSVKWASLAALLWASLPANYRTLGFVLMREDLSLPLYAIHLWWLARAARTRRTRDYLAAGLFVSAAAATWFAMGFVISVEALWLLIWFLWKDRNALAPPRAWLIPATLFGAALAVPALRAKYAYISFPLQVATALLVARALSPKPRAIRIAATLLTLLAWTAIAALTDAGEHFTHVRAVMAAKIEHFGILPMDPAELSFEARIMWQGPFATMGPFVALRVFQLSLLLAVPWLFVVLRRTWRGTHDNQAEASLALLTLATLAAAWFTMRMMVLAGLLLPVAACLALRRYSQPHASRRTNILLIAVVLLQTLFFVNELRGRVISWYSPTWHSEEIATMVRELPALVPEDQAVGCDPYNSTAVLAHTGRPIVLQPKWENPRTRARFQAFMNAFFHGTTDDVRRLFLERFQCRYLLIDRFMLWNRGYYLGGMHALAKEPLVGTAAELLLSQDEAVLRSIPGYELVWRSPETIVDRRGVPTDSFRLFRLIE